jgi:WD40 repeat protein
MLQHISFFYGHRGSVLSLTGQIEEKSFYSAGSEGLIVHWNVDKPNEGDVIIKLSGYISCLVFNSRDGILYAAVNHKGLYLIQASSGKILATIETPAISYGNLQVTNNHIIFTTKIGEVIILDKDLQKILKRVNTGINDFCPIHISSNLLCYSSVEGLQCMDLTSLDYKLKSIPVESTIKSICSHSNSLIVLSNKSLEKWNQKNLKKEAKLDISEIAQPKQLYINTNAERILILSVFNEIYEYKLDKKGIKFIEKSRIEHNGEINELLWIENYKFVISAGTDKKIGVCQIN